MTQPSGLVIPLSGLSASLCQSSSFCFLNVPWLPSIHSHERTDIYRYSLMRASLLCPIGKSNCIQVLTVLSFSSTLAVIVYSTKHSFFSLLHAVDLVLDLARHQHVRKFQARSFTPHGYGCLEAHTVGFTPCLRGFSRSVLRAPCSWSLCNLTCLSAQL